MPTTDQTVPADRVDPTVRIPESVRKAAEKANSYYAQNEPAKEPVTADADATINITENAPEKPVTEPVTTAPEPAKEPVPEPAKAQDQPATTSEPEPTQEDWRHRFLSMQGRFNASQRTIGSLQEQITQMGDEMLRLTAVVQGQNPGEQARHGQKFVTDKDVQEYGSELIDVVQRAALDRIAPELDGLKQQNAELQQRVAVTDRERMLSWLDGQMPEWRAVNKDPRFLDWLRLPNIYTGVVRKQMLNQAYSAAQAPRVLQFFRDFLAEEKATGHESTAPAQSAANQAPRHAAVALETLAAPGKARPASGNSSVPADDKPIFTRAQIAHFYRPDTIKSYAGREKDRAVMEAQIFAAQREGRVR